MKELSDRQRQILFFVIADFMARGEAVASAAVARSGALDVSAATIRNDMGDLEDLGFLSQPHTSAGRIPTAQGIRAYVDYVSKLPRGATPPLDLSPDQGDVEGTAARAGVLLSQLSNMAAVVVGPHVAQMRLRDLKLVSITETRLLAVLVTEDAQVLERMCTLASPVDALKLTKMQNYLSELVAGKTLDQLRRKVREELSEARRIYPDYEAAALHVGSQVTRESANKIRVEGLMNFLDFSELTSDVDRLRELLRAIEERERLLEVLDNLGEPRGTIAVIGPEIGEDFAKDLGIVVSPFYQGAEQIGLVGVLGPMRMDYGRMIPLVDQVARVLSRDTENEPDYNT
ncbi:MAG: heat-inducible transcriptional repressor HrcA [bacterium]